MAKSFKQLSAALSPEARRLVQLRVQRIQKRIDSKGARRAKNAPKQTAESENDYARISLNIDCVNPLPASAATSTTLR